MNKKQLLGLGVPHDAIDEAIDGVRKAATAGRFRGKVARKLVKEVLDSPSTFVADEHFAALANALTRPKEEPYECESPVPYQVWGRDGIDENALKQMDVACRLPVARAAACMSDSHLGYGICIGGVLATEDAIIPYAVGTDIACRMKLTVFDHPISNLQKDAETYESALENGTLFGVGGQWKPRLNHPVMDEDWNITDITKKMKDRAWTQLGTSGSGNHFVEFGVLVVDPPEDCDGITIGPGPDGVPVSLGRGQFLAVMSHSGSRGAGANVCQFYSDIAKQKLPKKYPDEFKHLAWLDMKSEAGQEYWAAMNLMGCYASANHACIHENIKHLIGAEVLLSVENHHNFCWFEEHNGKQLYVHRKGATPAALGDLGVIPGSMADPAFLVRGKGNPASLNSASHGAGRRMSRTQAIKTQDWKHWKGVLRQQGVKLLSGGLDEVPGVYKNIIDVMNAQHDLVEILAEFHPKIVKMSADGRSED